MTDDETKAMRDALTFGTGYMLDGKHVPMEAVMTDDLVKLLREWAVNYQCNSEWKIVWEAADRIEAQDKRNKELEAALQRANATTEEYERKFYLGNDRIEQLEAALREIAAGYETEWSTSSVTNMLDIAQILSERIVIARAALEEKKDG